MTEPLSHDDLATLRHAIDPATGRPAMEQARYRHDFFAAQVARAAADAASAPPPPTPNREALATLAELQGWRNPLTGRRAYEQMDELGQAVRHTVEHYREAAMRGEGIPADVLAGVRRQMADAQQEADRLKVEREAADLERFRRIERGE